MKNALAFISRRANLVVDRIVFDDVWKPRARSGEERLMLAVLENAVESFFKCLRSKDEKGKEIFQEAERWILKKNTTWIFSFDNVCDYLGISPSYLKAELVRRKEADNGSQKENLYSVGLNHASRQPTAAVGAQRVGAAAAGGG
jgi:hypothetical protein